MRISKTVINRGWTWSTLLGLIAFAVLTVMDVRLKTLTGLSTADLQGLSSALQYQLAFHAWAPEAYAAQAGFNLGFDFLLMPLYAVSFFLSGVIVAEAFTPGRHRLRRWVLLAAMVAPVGALLDMVENGLELTMLLMDPTDEMARIAYSVSNAKTVAITIGLVLLIGALLARVRPVKSAA